MIVRTKLPDGSRRCEARAVEQTVGLHRSLAVVWLSVLSIAIPCLAPAQPAPPSRADIQAVYLFDFAKFVRWPPLQDREPLTICVADVKPFAEALSNVVAGEKIDTHPIAVRSIQAAEEEGGCNILFVGVAAKERLGSLLSAAADKPILTVSDVPGFLDRGGMIQFLTIDNRVRFSVDLRPAARSGVVLSSQLLKVAVHVTNAPSGGGSQ